MAGGIAGAVQWPAQGPLSAALGCLALSLPILLGGLLTGCGGSSRHTSSVGQPSTSPTGAAGSSTTLNSGKSSSTNPTQLSAGPASSRSTAGHPYLVAVELSPEDPYPGGQFVWVANPTDGPVSLGCWKLRSRATGTQLAVDPGDSPVPAAATVRLTPPVGWLAMTDTVTLTNPSGNTIDVTPQLTDDSHDDRIWYRAPTGEWRFGRPQFSQQVVSGHLQSGTPRGC